MTKITKEQILFPGVELEATTLDPNSPEVQQLIEHTIQQQLKILNMQTDLYVVKDKILGAAA